MANPGYRSIGLCTCCLATNLLQQLRQYPRYGLWKRLLVIVLSYQRTTVFGLTDEVVEFQGVTGFENASGYLLNASNISIQGNGGCSEV